MKYCPLATQDWGDKVGQAECKESCAWYSNVRNQCVMVCICEELITIADKGDR
jgi:hypothetical protein